jgi:uncharacterized membrane protein YhhN
MMIYLLVPLILAVINWGVLLQLEKGDSRVFFRAECISKPAVILALLIWLGFVGHYQGPLMWFGLALLFSMIGDIALLHSYKRTAVSLALVSFFITHIFFIFGLNPSFPPRLNNAGYLVFGLVAIVSIQLGRRVFNAPRLAGKPGSKAAVIAYIVALDLMLTSALFAYTQGEIWQEIPALLVGTGGVLFFLSDTLLGWRLFVAPFPHAKLSNRIAYHLGQIAIIAGAVLHFLPPA